MLSIGKLATGQADYYLEQAQGSDRVLSGQHPGTREALGRVLSARVPGFDLTFSAPKSVSVLFGIGDDELRAVLRDAHDRAVIDALSYMEREAAVTRRGPGGVHAIAGHGLVAAAFRHRTSRAGDPQLHTHVLVANLTLGADGRWSTLDGRRIYAHAKTAGYLYEARLRSLLTQELGVEWTPARNGIADIAGVPPTVLRAFSRRRADIKAELERRGTTSAAAAQVAALQTRRAKDYRVTPEQLMPEWRERARELGLDPERLSVLGRRLPPLELDAELEQSIVDWMAGSDGLTHRRSTFTRRDVIQAVCERLPAGVRASIADIEGIADRFLTSDRVVALAVGGRPAARTAYSVGTTAASWPRFRRSGCTPRRSCSRLSSGSSGMRSRARTPVSASLARSRSTARSRLGRRWPASKW